MVVFVPCNSGQLLLTRLLSQSRDHVESATYWLTVRNSWRESSLSASSWLSEGGVLEDLTEYSGKELRSQFLKDDVMLDGRLSHLVGRDAPTFRRSQRHLGWHPPKAPPA